MPFAKKNNVSDTEVETPQVGAPPPMSKKKKVVAIVAVVNLLLIGVVAAVAANQPLTTGAPPAATAAAPATPPPAPAPAKVAEKPAKAAAPAPSAPANTQASTSSKESFEIDPDVTDGLEMKFGSFVVNLANVERPRFLKLEIWFQMEDDATKQAVVRNKSRIRHTIISYLSGLKVESTIGPLAKEEMSFAVKKLVNTILPVSPITRVYFTEFVVN